MRCVGLNGFQTREKEEGLKIRTMGSLLEENGKLLRTCTRPTRSFAVQVAAGVGWHVVTRARFANCAYHHVFHSAKRPEVRCITLYDKRLIVVLQTAICCVKGCETHREGLENGGGEGSNTSMSTKIRKVYQPTLLLHDFPSLCSRCRWWGRDGITAPFVVGVNFVKSEKKTAIREIPDEYTSTIRNLTLIHEAAGRCCCGLTGRKDPLILANKVTH